MDILNWVGANTGSIIAGAAVALAVALALRSIWKQRKTGGCSCGCGAAGYSSSCPGCSSCAKYTSCDHKNVEER